ncbi:hypothetical protein LARI1_G006764 [Lachnellula arida]|uniref:Aminoglycoside phosphotransferase domain-containing protein n=1 Tax=Lachnellula arida TaxID=1316785 RepID=A0A8T9B5X3_9HELO|nr:hypothetical protein LARI1_G006764 [Lachnellula arida]
MSDTVDTVKAEQNQRLMQLLGAELESNPDADLSTIFGRFQLENRPPKSKKPPPKNMDYCETLIAYANDAEVVYPLSDSVESLLRFHNRPIEPSTGNSKSVSKPSSSDHQIRGPLPPPPPGPPPPRKEMSGQTLVRSLKHMISTCERCWDDMRGVVLKCNGSIAAKILSGTHDYTEYTALQYLALHMPDVPAPKPLGLVTFSGCRIMFMTYFPSMTLEQAWPNLNHENKLSIQQQLETIFSRLRSMKKPAGLPLGGVNGEGVKDWHMDRREGLRKDSIKTVEEFEDMLFTVDEWPPTKAWTRLLRSFLPAPKTTVCVFTHGDFRAANVMVDQDDNERFFVTGIIDWETSGFYPDYFESMQVLWIFDAGVENDWWEYLPTCIAPSSNLERFLVGRIWDSCIGFGAAPVPKPQTRAC